MLRDWRIQRVTWVLWAAVVLLAICGAFGKGMLAAAVAHSGETLTVRYNRIVRWQSHERLNVSIQPPPNSDRVLLWVDRAYITAMNAEKIMPEPMESRVEGDRLLLEFSVTPGQSLHIQFDLKPQERWGIDGGLGLVSGPEARFSQFVLP